MKNKLSTIFVAAVAVAFTSFSTALAADPEPDCTGKEESCDKSCEGDSKGENVFECNNTGSKKYVSGGDQKENLTAFLTSDSCADKLNGVRGGLISFNPDEWEYTCDQDNGATCDTAADLGCHTTTE